MSVTRFEEEIVHLRLPSFMFARYGRPGITRQASVPSDAWNEALGQPNLAQFTWSTFNDGQLPRAIGMRLTNLQARGHYFEVAEWYAPTRIIRSHWRCRPYDGWRELNPTEAQ